MHFHVRTFGVAMVALAMACTNLAGQTLAVTNVSGSIAARYQIGSGFANSFTLGTTDAVLDGVSVFFKISDAAFTATIHADNAGTVGAVLCSATRSGLTTGGSGIIEFSGFSGTTRLLADSTYWLEISANDNPSSTSGWYVANTASSSDYGWEINNGIRRVSDSVWYTQASSSSEQFRIYATPVPEPSVFACASGAGALLFVLVRRRR